MGLFPPVFESRCDQQKLGPVGPLILSLSPLLDNSLKFYNCTTMANYKLCVTTGFPTWNVYDTMLYGGRLFGRVEGLKLLFEEGGKTAHIALSCLQVAST